MIVMRLGSNATECFRGCFQDCFRVLPSASTVQAQVTLLHYGQGVKFWSWKQLKPAQVGTSGSSTDHCKVLKARSISKAVLSASAIFRNLKPSI